MLVGECQIEMMDPVSFNIGSNLSIQYGALFFSGHSFVPPGGGTHKNLLCALERPQRVCDLKLRQWNFLKPS